MQKFETVFNTKITFKVPANLLSDGMTNTKTKKNNVKSFILYLAPANQSGVVNVCPFASPGCKDGCLYKAGLGGVYPSVQNARINRTKFWAADRQLFYTKLGNELLMIAATYKKAAVRLNGTSDIDHIDLLKRYTGIDFLSKKYKNIKFYDYTKNINIIKKYAGTSYHLTFSKSETNDIQVQQALEFGANVAAVFSHTLPDTYLGYPVVDGDLTDYRPEDGKGVIVGLVAKGPAKKDKSGFVIQN
jgi:hypothetical protein